MLRVVFCVVLLLAACDGSMDEGAPTAAKDAEHAEIAFVKENSIYVIAADGTGMHKLSSGGIEVGPAWSPDGKRIACAASGTILRVMNADGSGIREVVTDIPGDVASPAWSPDGRKLAFNVYLRSGGSAIYVVDEDGSNLTKLLEEEANYPGYVHWSPDGGTLVYRDGTSDEDADLYTMNTDEAG